MDWDVKIVERFDLRRSSSSNDFTRLRQTYFLRLALDTIKCTVMWIINCYLWFSTRPRNCRLLSHRQSVRVHIYRLERCNITMFIIYLLLSWLIYYEYYAFQKITVYDYAYLTVVPSEIIYLYIIFVVVSLTFVNFGRRA